MAEPPKKRIPEERKPPEIPEVKTEDLLREARVSALAFARRRRSVLAARDMAKKYVAYFTSKYARTKSPKDYEKLMEWRANLATYEARYNLLRNMGRYARNPTAENELSMRRAQEEYYRAKMLVATPEERRRIEEEVLPQILDQIERLEEELRIIVTPPPLPPPEEYETEEEYRRAVREQVLERLCASYRVESIAIETRYRGAKREERLKELGYEYFSKMYVGIREAEERASELWEARRP